jgi:hypothetical protein
MVSRIFSIVLFAWGLLNTLTSASQLSKAEFVVQQNNPFQFYAALGGSETYGVHNITFSNHQASRTSRSFIVLANDLKS